MGDVVAVDVRVAAGEPGERGGNLVSADLEMGSSGKEAEGEKDGTPWTGLDVKRFFGTLYQKKKKLTRVSTDEVPWDEDAPIISRLREATPGGKSQPWDLKPD